VVTPTPCPPPPPRGKWLALTSVTHRDDAVDGGPCIHLNNRPLLSLILAKLASSTSPQKPPATYTGSTILDNIRTRFLGGDLYARAIYTRVYMVCALPPSKLCIAKYSNASNFHLTTVYFKSVHGINDTAA